MSNVELRTGFPVLQAIRLLFPLNGIMALTK